MIENAAVYTGLWKDWSQQRTNRTIITLSERDGTILSAFVAVLLSFTGTQLWKILVYLFHQTRYRKACVNGHEHQERAIVRNSSSPGPTAWLLFLQCIFWKKPLRTLPLLLMAALYLIAFAAIAILIPASLHTDPVRLLTPLNCGYLDTTSLNDMGLKALKLSQEAVLQSQTCYKMNASDPCETYPVFRVDFTEDVPCPFMFDICYTTNNSNVFRMATPLLNSRTDLGINHPESISYRSVSTCSILREGSYSTVSPPGATKEDPKVIRWFYGPTVNTNFTFVYSTWATQLPLPYTLIHTEASPGRQGNWTPIPELKRLDADVNLISIQPNSVRYKSRVTDPMFSATRPADEIGVYTDYTNSTYQYSLDDDEYYMADFFATIVGCATQYQICNNHTGVCSPLRSLDQTFSPQTDSRLNLTPVQSKIAERIYDAATWSSLSFVLNTRSGLAIQASSLLMQGYILALPDDQYLREFKGWFTTGLAMFQRHVRNYVIGDGTHVPPSSLIERELCSAQRVPYTDSTMSFSLTHLLAVVCLCGITILLSYTLEPAVSWVQCRPRYKTRTRPALWRLDDTLQLQRALFENLGYGKWTSSSWLPTASDQPFGQIDFRWCQDPRFAEQMASLKVGTDDADNAVDGKEISTSSREIH